MYCIDKRDELNRQLKVTEVLYDIKHEAYLENVLRIENNLIYHIHIVFTGFKEEKFVRCGPLHRATQNFRSLANAIFYCWRFSGPAFFSSAHTAYSPPCKDCIPSVSARRSEFVCTPVSSRNVTAISHNRHSSSVAGSKQLETSRCDFNIQGGQQKVSRIIIKSY